MTTARTIQTTPKGFDADTIVFSVSCQKYRDRVQACRDTWVKQLNSKGIRVYFVEGDPLQKEEFILRGDVLSLKCGDGYFDLPAKTRMISEYFIHNNEDCEYMFKCDDDTYIHVDNFIEFDKQGNDYIGFPLSASCASGGGGYYLSLRSAIIIASSNMSKGAEDVEVGKALKKEGILLTPNKKFKPWPDGWKKSSKAEAEDTRDDIPPPYNLVKDNLTNHLIRFEARHMYTFHNTIMEGKS